MHFSPLFVKKEIQRRTVIEIYYYNHMNKTQQSAYHNILQGFQNMADEILIPRLEPEELYNVFFQLRLDHPEIFWATGFRYKYYQDSPNLIFIPEYLFEKKKIKEIATQMDIAETTVKTHFKRAMAILRNNLKLVLFGV